MDRTGMRMRSDGMAEERKKRQRKSKSAVKGSYYDYSLLFLTLFLVAFGLIMIYSTSSYSAQLTKGDSLYYFKRQGICAVMGTFVMLMMSKINCKIALKRLPGIKFRIVSVAYVFTLILQAYTTFFGMKINDARRWINLKQLGTFQTSDLSKIVTIFFISYMIHLNPKQASTIGGFFKISLYVLPMIALIGKENLSTAIIMCALLGGICFVASRKKWFYILVVAIMAAGVFILILSGEGFRLTRVQSWLDIENSGDNGFQIRQGLYAIASGGLTGRGLGGSMQKLGYVPESWNDMIFSIICEELGLFGAVTVLFLFVLLIWRIFIIAINAPDLYSGLLCTGVLIQIAVQAIINVAVVTNSIPSTGIALPFISYGGTSVMMLLLEIGVVLNVSDRIRYER